MSRDYSTDFWRMVLEDLVKAMSKGVTWTQAVVRVAKEWKVKPGELLGFVHRHNLGTKLKAGALTHSDILRTVSTLSKSEMEFDAYTAKNPLRREESLTEGERGYGAWHYSATAQHYHGVLGADGVMEGTGPNLSNDDRLLENHLKNLQAGRPVDNVVLDLLETGRHKVQPQSVYMNAINKYASNSKLHVYRGSIK